MKQYPSISSMVQMGLPIYAFDKIDGSNIRAEFSKKKGFHKFGSRKRLLGDDQPIISKAQKLIQDQTDSVAAICSRNKWDKVILFYEFAGPKSSFGNHIEDDDHKVWLIDANPYKKGILPPSEFLEAFDSLEHSPLLYRGNCTNSFVQSVKDGKLEGMGSEGVVCKAKGRGNELIFFKIKSESWYSRLRDHCKDDDKLYQVLM